MHTPPLAIQNAVRERILQNGDTATSRALGVSRQTIARIAAGLPVHRVTLVAIAFALRIDLSDIVSATPSITRGRSVA